MALTIMPGSAMAKRATATFPQILTARGNSFTAPDLLVALYEGDTTEMNRTIRERSPDLQGRVPFGPTPARVLKAYVGGVLTGIRHKCPAVLTPYSAKMAYHWPDVQFTDDGGYDYRDDQPIMVQSVDDGLAVTRVFGCASPGMKRLVANGVAYMSGDLLPYSKAQTAARQAVASGDTNAFFANLMQRIVETDSRSWFMNRFDAGSVRTSNIRLGADRNSAVVRATYSYNGGQQGWVVLNITDARNNRMCLQYWDFQGTCRPVGDVSHYGYKFFQVMGELNKELAR